MLTAQLWLPRASELDRERMESPAAAVRAAEPKLPSERDHPVEPGETGFLSNLAHDGGRVSDVARLDLSADWNPEPATVRRPAQH